jgi:hypothetical protein
MMAGRFVRAMHAFHTYAEWDPRHYLRARVADRAAWPVVCMSSPRVISPETSIRGGLLDTGKQDRRICLSMVAFRVGDVEG